MNGPGEQLILQASHPVTSYIQGPGAPALTLPYSGSWQNNNNINSSVMEFAGVDRLQFRVNSNSGVSSVIGFGLTTGPEIVEYDACDIVELFGASQRFDGGASTTISGIDLQPTGNANEFTVSVSWVDGDGNAQTTTDPTPITVTGPDTFGTVATAAATLTTTNNVDVAIGGRYILMSDGTTWGAPSEFNTPSTICNEILLPVGAGGVAVGEPNPQVTGFLMYTEQVASLRFANIPTDAEDHVVPVYYDPVGDNWHHADNTINAAAPLGWPTFTPDPTDFLLADVTFGSGGAGGSVFNAPLPAGQTGGIPHRENLAGLTSVTGNQYVNGNPNTGEFHIIGSIDLGTLFADLQLEGTYLPRNGDPAPTVPQAIAAGWTVCPPVVEAVATPPDPVNPEFYKAAGSVAGDGIAEQIAGGSVVRVAVGQYDVTFNSAAFSDTYPVLATMQGLPQNDDYQWAYLNRTVNGFRIEIREQDNGGAAGVLRDSGFSFFVPII